jgi:hypothetical protein
MKKVFLTGLVGMLALFILPGCEKNNLAIDKEAIVPSFAKFNVRNTADTTGVYYIGASGNTFKIPIGITGVSNVDRTIQLCYASSTGAVAGTHYNAPSSIVIPAGKTVDSITIQGLFSGYPLSSRIDTLRVTICGGDVPVQDLKNNFRVVLRKYCPVDLAALAGNYTNTMEPSYGPYTTTISGLTMVAGSTTKATGQIANLYDDGWSPVTATFDWTDPANFKVSIASQATGKGYNVRTTAGAANTFSSCDRSVTVFVDLHQGSSVLLSSYKIVMK